MTTFANKTILVTGGAGFIGSNFIRHILSNHTNTCIINLDKLTYAGNLDNLRDVESDPRYQFIRGDICQRQVIRPLLQVCDIVVHFAAETHVDRSITGSTSFIQTDIVGTYTLLDEARDAGIELFIHISTDEIYGSCKSGKFKESDTLNPSSPYSAAKVAGDRLAYSYYVTYGLPVVILRPSNNFGPYQYPEKLIPLFTTNALLDKPLGLYGDGLQVRDWLYVEDTCRAIEVVAERGTPGEAYNVGADNERVNVEIAKKILDVLGKPEGLITYIDDRLGHDRRYSIDSYKLWKLGWQPQARFDEAFESTVRWYEDNPDWWKKLRRN